MTNPLLYAHGGFRWMPNMKSNIKNCNISALQFYSYKLLIIDEFNPFLYLWNLTQQYVVDASVKVESSRLYFIQKIKTYEEQNTTMD